MGRSQRCVCKYCGGQLEVRTIVFNEILDARTELFCTHCDRIEYGVEKELYQSACYFVETFDYNCEGLRDHELGSQRSGVHRWKGFLRTAQ